MSTQHLNVVAVLTAEAGSEKLVGEALTALVAPTRAEEGNISYEVFVSAADPAIFVAVEIWKSQDDLNAHTQAPYVQQAFKTASDHLAQAPAIYRLSRL